jgi:hypothetical protein
VRQHFDEWQGDTRHIERLKGAYLQSVEEFDDRKEKERLYQ